MAIFDLRKCNGNWTDLQPDQIEWYNSCKQFVANSTHLSGKIGIADIVQIIQDFGGQKALWGLKRLHGLGYNSLDTLQGLLEGTIPSERKITPAKGAYVPQTQSNRPKTTYQKPTPQQEAELVPPPDWLMEQVASIAKSKQIK